VESAGSNRLKCGLMSLVLDNSLVT